MKRGFAVMFVMADGREEYVCSGLSSIPSRFSSKRAAKEQGEFLAMGFDDGDYQSFDIVSYPSAIAEPGDTRRQ